MESWITRIPTNTALVHIKMMHKCGGNDCMCHPLTYHGVNHWVFSGQGWERKDLWWMLTNNMSEHWSGLWCAELYQQVTVQLTELKNRNNPTTKVGLTGNTPEQNLNKEHMGSMHTNLNWKQDMLLGTESSCCHKWKGVWNKAKSASFEVHKQSHQYYCDNQYNPTC